MEMAEVQLDAAQRRRMAFRRVLRRNSTAYLFIIPNLLVFIIYMVVPLFWNLYLSFFSGGVLTEAKFVGLENWTGMLQDTLVRRTLTNTTYYTLIVIPTAIGLSLLLAVLLASARRLSGAFKSMLYFPNLAPVVLSALAWVFVVHYDFGILNTLLRLVGLSPQNWLGDANLAIPIIVLLEIWRGIGFYIILFLAAIVSIPQELFEAARIDGARAWAQFRHITLPQLRPVLLFALIMATIWNFQLFDSVAVLTDGGPANRTATVVWYIYKNAFQFNNPGYAAAMSIGLLAIVMVLAFVQLKFLQSEE